MSKINPNIIPTNFSFLSSKGTILFFLLVAPFLLNGQTTLQVVTKTIEKNFTYREDVTVNIKGEKAIVEVRSWEKDQIKSGDGLNFQASRKKSSRN